MKATRKKCNAFVADNSVYRNKARLPLTPYAKRVDMIAAGRVVQTSLDVMLSAAEADALERWAANEQVLEGKAKTQSWGNTANGAGIREFAPVSDHQIATVIVHSGIKKKLADYTLETLSAFTAMQNRHAGALSAAQYGMLLCPDAKNKNQSFYHLVKAAAQMLVLFRY